MDAQQENPNATPAPEGAEPEQSGTGRAEHTAEIPANQDKLASLLGRIDRRINDIQSLMTEKEHQQLLFVFKKVPMPYYERWKGEGNDLFALTVHIRRRRARAKKAG